MAKQANKELNKDAKGATKNAKKKQKKNFWMHFGYASLALGVSVLVWFITTIL